MKKSFFISLLISMALNIKANAQIVNIPDSNFKSALVNNVLINTNSDSEIQVSEALSFSNDINLFGSGISDLTGIEAFVNLNLLSCRYTLISSLDLSFNTNLRFLYCSDNQLQSLVLPSTGIIELICYNNFLTSLNLSNHVTLELLWCDNNSLTSLDLSSLPNLDYVTCSYNNLTTLNTTSDTLLRILRCDNNNLQFLDLSTNPSLYEINCGFNNLTDINFNSNYSLREILCEHNNLTSLDLLGAPYVYFVYCNNNYISELDLSLNRTLYSLKCNNNLLTNLYLDTLYGNLRLINCSSNNLTKVDLTRDLSLEELICSKNFLDSLDISNNLSLKTLSCDSNNISLLNLDLHQRLINLNCSYNILTSMNLSSDTALEQVYVNSNNLSFLNLRNGYNFLLQNSEFNTSQNPLLTCIQVDSIAYSTSNWTNIDPWSTFSTNCLVGINENDNKNEIRIYPNPVINELSINLKSSTGFQIEIYNILGDIIYSTSLNDQFQNIDVSTLISGIYIIKFTDKFGEITTKRFNKL